MQATHSTDSLAPLNVIPAHPAQLFTKPVFAAGAVLFRQGRIAVVHRPRYDDWSLPKGKVDPGESLPETAVREIKEETGFDVTLGGLLGHVSYPLGKRTKVVYYFTADAREGEFEPNNECDQLLWLSPEEAVARVSYPMDKDIIERAVKRTAHPVDARVLLVRHAHAHPRRTWTGDDSMRPLDKKGRRQADALVRVLDVYNPTGLYTASPDRCMTTIRPFAMATMMDLTIEPAFDDDTYATDPRAAAKALSTIVSSGGTTVVCSQGLVIPELLGSLDESLRGASAKKASVWVLDFHKGSLVAPDYIESPLPVK